MVPLRDEWTPFADLNDQIEHYRLWGLIPPKSKKLRPVMVVDGYWDAPQPCKVVGYHGDNWAVIELDDGVHGIHGEYLAELQPIAYQKLPHGICFAEILSKYVVLDIETTGFNRETDRIIEIAAVKYEYGQKIDVFQTLVNPQMILPDNIIALTGITQEDLCGAPSLEEIERDFFAFISDLPIIGHNIISFDAPFLSANLSKSIENATVDTLLMARGVFDLLPKHKLSYLKAVLELDNTNSHRALNDVETTNALLWACLAPRKYEKQVFHAFLDNRLNSTAIPKRKSRAESKRKKVSIRAIKPSSNLLSRDGPLTGKSILFTGELSISRVEAMQKAVDAGAVLKSGVSKKLDYLVVGTQDITIVGMDGMSSKELKAKELNETGKAHIIILSEEEFMKMLSKGEPQIEGTD